MPLRRSATSLDLLPSAAGGSSRGNKRGYIRGEVISSVGVVRETEVEVDDDSFLLATFADDRGEIGRGAGAVDGRFGRRRDCILLENDDF